MITSGYELFIYILCIANASMGGGTRGALGTLTPTKFVSAHRNLIFLNRNVSC